MEFKPKSELKKDLLLGTKVTMVQMQVKDDRLNLAQFLGKPMYIIEVRPNIYGGSTLYRLSEQPRGINHTFGFDINDAMNVIYSGNIFMLLLKGKDVTIGDFYKFQIGDEQ